MIYYFEMLKSIRSEPDASKEPPSHGLTETERLRLAMAMRGWTDPRALAPEVSEETLEALAPDVETSVVRPGKWRLRDGVRRRVLMSATSADIDSALRAANPGENDPILKALQTRRGGSPEAIERLDEETLAALQATLVWAPEFRDFEPPFHLQERAAAALARRRRDADIARLIAQPLYGRDSQLAALVAFSTTPASAWGRFVYLWGVGGAGKSTLFACLEETLRNAPAPPILAHIDCDQPGFDPADPVALVTTLFRQLSLLAPPREALELRGRMQQLAHAAKDAMASNVERTGARRGRAAETTARRAFAKKATPSFEALESAVSDTQDALSSIAFNALRGVCGSGQPLVLLVDTAELIFARGEENVSTVRDWLEAIGGLMGVADLRVIMAARTPPDAIGPVTLMDALSARPHWQVSPPIALPDLDIADAFSMLEGLGVDSPEIAHAAALALPKTPLVLRIAASVWEDVAERPGFVEAVARGAVNGAVAARYLAERVVRHLSSVAARPYVLAACVPPFIGRAELRDIVIPAVDGNAPGEFCVDAAYTGLAAAGWLTRRDPDGDRLDFHPEVRRLILSMMRADAKQAALMSRVRDRGMRHHAGKRGDSDRTLAAYYAEMNGAHAPQRDRKKLDPSVLGAALEDLSEDARRRLFGAQIATNESDEQWRRRLEGASDKDGEGDRLVKRGRAAEALALYRRRPTQEKGLPPTFFIQALADDAQWDSDEVDIARAVGVLQAELDHRGAASELLRSRLYWLTRLALQTAPGPLEEPHWLLLRKVAERITAHGPLLMFPTIMAVAESFSPERGPLAPRAWLEAKGAVESQTRMFLVHRLFFHFEGRLRPMIESHFVAQPDWPERFLGLLEGAEPGRVGKQLDGLFENVVDIPKFNSRLRTLRGSVSVDIGPQLDAADTILLLRGQTIETHRPLRAAIGRLLAAEPSSAARLADIARRTVNGFGFRTREFGDELEERMTSDLAGLFKILIPFADRARRLPTLCRLLSDLPETSAESKMVVRVARTFLTWDAALCAGETSNWGEERGEEEEEEEMRLAAEEARGED